MFLKDEISAWGAYFQCLDGEAVEDMSITDASAKAQTASTSAAEGDEEVFSV